MSPQDPIDEADDPAPDLRAEGVAVSRAPRTVLASIALFAPTVYGAALVLRDGSWPFPARLGLLVGSVLAIARIAPAIDDLEEDARGSAKIALSTAGFAATVSSGVPLADASTLVRIAVVVAAAIAGAAAVRCAAAISGLGGVAVTQVSAIVRGARRVAIVWLSAGAVFALSLLPIAAGEAARRVRLPFALATFLATVAHAIASGRRRRLELGARERHDLALGAAALCLPLAIVVAAGARLERATVDVALVAASLALVAAVLVAQLARDPVSVAARVGRSWVVLTMGWVAAFAFFLAAPGPFVALGIGVGIGIAAPFVSRFLGVEGDRVGAIRAAIAQARDASGAGDPNEVARGVLSSLRTLAGPSGKPAAPRLLLFSPLREVVLDAASEPRTRDPLPTGEPVPDPDAPSPVSRVVPRELLSLSASEPLGVVRTEVLRALEVRRPDLRSSLRWCDDREAAAVVALVVDGELDGLLLLPNGPNARDIGLREVRALRAIARLSAMRLALEAALARSAARAQRAELRAREVEHVAERAHDREARLVAVAAAAARPLESKIAVSGYAPGSRALFAEIDALASSPAHLVVVHRPGSDPAPWIARLHRASGARGALHVVDASRAEGADPARWGDPSASPIELARDGTLLVLAANVLGREAQRRLLAALSFREGPGRDPTPVALRLVLAVASRDPEGDDLARLRSAVDASLVAHLREAPLRVPPLSRRSEDVRALSLDRLAAIGQALRGEPLGLAPEALGALVEHAWPGDDLELDAVLTRAAVRARGSRVERADVLAVLTVQPDGSGES